mmetsp:Transcript_74653/g.125814  ORF Transcript_74653/g.125814 Transcript_74653/m.125814 type:complete len:274 (-) Transcript_74653:788-1609(-)
MHICAHAEAFTFELNWVSKQKQYHQRVFWALPCIFWCCTHISAPAIQSNLNRTQGAPNAGSCSSVHYRHLVGFSESLCKHCIASFHHAPPSTPLLHVHCCSHSAIHPPSVHPFMSPSLCLCFSCPDCIIQLCPHCSSLHDYYILSLCNTEVFGDDGFGLWAATERFEPGDEGLPTSGLQYLVRTRVESDEWNEVNEVGMGRSGVIRVQQWYWSPWGHLGGVRVTSSPAPPRESSQNNLRTKTGLGSGARMQPSTCRCRHTIPTKKARNKEKTI